LSKSVLHILNGDSTLEKFKEAGISGQSIVWRETLSIGPLFYLVDSQLFWDMRSQFMEEAYGAKLAGYKRKIINEFAILRKSEVAEIVLWYEYDVFCQINFIALMSFILKRKRNTRVSVVCVGDDPRYQDRIGLGQLSAEDYPSLLENRQALTRKDLMTADKAWMLYCGMAIDEFEGLDCDNLPYLKDALMASLVLFRGGKDFSPLELKIKAHLAQGAPKGWELVEKMLEEDKSLGFGDLQFKYLISKVEDVV